MQSLGVEDREIAEAAERVRRNASRAVVLPRVLRRPARLLAHMKAPRRAGLKAAAVFFAVTLTAGVVLGGHVMTVASAVTAAAGFRIENVKITGQSQTSEVDVLGALDIGTYPSLLTLDIEAAKARIEALPWVRQATLVKLFPDSLDIAIAERDPFALWQHDGLTSLVDRSGRVIAETSDERYAALPRVVGAGAAERVGEYTALLQAVPAIAKRARAGVLVSERRWNVVLDNGIEVMLPPDGAEAALERVAALDASRQLLSREVAAVDVRDSDRLVLRLTEAGRKAVAATARQRGRS